MPYIYDQRLRSEAMAGRRVTPETDNDEKGARALEDGAQREMKNGFVVFVFLSRRRRRPVRVGGMEGGREAPLTWGD